MRQEISSSLTENSKWQGDLMEMILLANTQPTAKKGRLTEDLRDFFCDLTEKENLYFSDQH